MSDTEGPSSITRSPAGMFQSNHLSALLFMKTNSPHGPEQSPSTNSKVGRSKKRSAEEAVGVKKSPKPKKSKASKTGFGPLMESFQAQPRIEDYQQGPHPPTTGPLSQQMLPSSSSAAHAPGFLSARHDTLPRLLALAERHRQQELFEMGRQRLVALQTRKQLLLVQGRHQLPELSSFNNPLLRLELELARRRMSGPSSLRQHAGLFPFECASTTPLSRLGTGGVSGLLLQRDAAMRGAQGISDHSLTEAAYKNHLSSGLPSCRNTVPNATTHLIERYSSGGTKEPPFPLKLHLILSKPEFQDLITWLPHGQAWRILKPTAFENVVIPHFFRHAKYASFMRQVNGWGFKRTVQGVEHNSYYHELFSRDDPERCMKMKRIGASKNAAGELVEELISPAASEKTDTDEQDQGPIGDKQEMAKDPSERI